MFERIWGRVWGAQNSINDFFAKCALLKTFDWH